MTGDLSEGTKSALGKLGPSRSQNEHIRCLAPGQLSNEI